MNDSFTERMRIDSSGNLLVGKTTTSNATAGAELNARSIVGTFASGTHILGRNTNDGGILEFQKTAPVGSIGVKDNDNLYIVGGTGSTKGLFFNDDAIAASSGGTLEDNSTDLDTFIRLQGPLPIRQGLCRHRC